jgi:hypothetical protein
MNENNMQCLNCQKEIEEPICERCRTRELASWLQDCNVPWSLQKEFFVKLEKSLPKLLYEGYCLICGNERPSLCDSCFSQEASKVVKELSNNQMLQSYFTKHDQANKLAV